MFKTDVSQAVEKVLPKIEALEQQRKELERDNKYTMEYKLNKDKELKAAIDNLHQEAIKDIQTISENELSKLGTGDNPNSEMATANILKMLEITKDTITEDNLQEILDNNLNDLLVVSTVLSISQSKNLNINKPINEVELIKDSTTKLIQNINAYGINSTGTQLALHYLPE